MKEIQYYIRNTLAELYSVEEKEALMWLVLEHVCRKPRSRLLAEGELHLTDGEREQVRVIVGRLLLFEPVQYILGEAFFCGHLFRVNRDTLIPRPETEELVRLILADYADKKHCRFLDMGTGSGCIAVSLAKNLPGADVLAMDISVGALAVAEENARLLRVENVSFFRADMLSPADWTSLCRGAVDCIVSNPPYISEKEKAAMERNVLDYEPPAALFVPDDDPLLFYRAIAASGLELLTPGGCIYVEINAEYGREVQELMTQAGYRQAELIRDIFGKDRIIKVER
ncbi:MAG: peptide chain release factor N(5)-glutamine methyltransferase [Tannerellaceae bacterium]|jgi:release factor glutamine methyltransferase|nr:peptide chain release factor N(5)-glutamine methyltransferase [Tannerellaceae bacterium]